MQNKMIAFQQNFADKKKLLSYLLWIKLNHQFQLPILFYDNRNQQYKCELDVVVENANQAFTFRCDILK